jgi:hypothetical protein
MTTVDRNGKDTEIRNDYVRGRIASVTVGKQGTYRFDYLFGPAGRPVETRIFAPDGNKTLLRF